MNQNSEPKNTIEDTPNSVLTEEIKMRRETIAKKHDKKNTYDIIEEAAKEESYNMSLFASDKKVTKIEDEKWVEDINEVSMKDEPINESHASSMSKASNEESLKEKEASGKAHLDQIEERDQNYIDFNNTRENRKTTNYTTTKESIGKPPEQKKKPSLTGGFKPGESLKLKKSTDLIKKLSSNKPVLEDNKVRIY